MIDFDFQFKLNNQPERQPANWNGVLLAVAVLVLIIGFQVFIG